MRKMKSIISLAISILMLFSFIPAGAFNIADDVEGTSYEESAYVLGALGIMVGDGGTGNFRPEDNITRAEFAKVAVALLGMEDLANASKDITSYKDVSVNHWANGYINVATAQQLVIGVGNNMFNPESSITYEEAVTILVRAMGYEPSANNKGGYPAGFLSVAASTGLTKNAASAASEPVKRGIIANLTNNALTINMMEQTGFGTDTKFEVVDKTILRDKLDVIKDKGQVTANGYSTLEGSSGLEKDEVMLNNTIYKKGKSNADTYLGYYVNYYVKVDEDSVHDTVLLVRPDKSRNKTVIASGDHVVGIKNGEFEYWIDKDKDSTTKKVKVSTDAKVIYNGVATTNEVLAELSDNFQGTYKLLEVTGDDKYDIIFVDEIKNLIVEDVNEKNFKITDKYGNYTLTLDPDDDAYNFIMVDKNHDNVDIKDLKEWDVLSHTVSKDKKLIRVFVSRETVEGKIKEISDNRYTINDKEYETANDFDGDLKLEDEGIFYLDSYGRIAAVNKSLSAGKNYAYLINTGLDGVVDKSAIFKILTTSNEVKTLKAEDKIKFDGQTGVKSEEAVAALKSDGKTKSQLITYKTNQDGKITEIDLATDNTSTQTIDKYDFVNNVKADDVKYKASSKKLGKYNITDSTIIFDIPESSDDYNDYTVANKSLFEDESLYNILIYDVTEDLNAGVVIVTNSDGKTNLESPLAVVSKITTTRNSDGVEVERLYAAYNGEIKTFETEATGVLVKDKKPLESGDVIQLKLDSKGVIEKFDLIFDISKRDTEFTKDISEKMTVVYGKVTKKFANSINVTVNDGASDNYLIGDAKIYTYNSEKSSNKVSLSTSADILRYDEEDKARVFIRIYDDIVKEIIIIK